MKLIIALGNPGSKYLFTRHNAGFILLDLLMERNAGTWSKSLFKAETGRVRLFGEDCWVVKPQTFMNLSGESVGPLAHFLKIDPKDWVVLHDDVDVPAMKVKARLGGSSGGHNGINNIISVTGHTDFHRIKLGIGKPGAEDKVDVRTWVLQEFRANELDELKTIVYDQALERLRNIFIQNSKGE